MFVSQSIASLPHKFSRLSPILLASSAASGVYHNAVPVVEPGSLRPQLVRCVQKIQLSVSILKLSLLVFRTAPMRRKHVILEVAVRGSGYLI